PLTPGPPPGRDLVGKTGGGRVLRDRFEPAPSIAVLGLEPPQGSVRTLRVVVLEELANRLIGRVGDHGADSRPDHHRQQNEHEAPMPLSPSHDGARWCTERADTFLGRARYESNGKART